MELKTIGELIGGPKRPQWLSNKPNTFGVQAYKLNGSTFKIEVDNNSMETPNEEGKKIIAGFRKTHEEAIKAAGKELADHPFDYNAAVERLRGMVIMRNGKKVETFEPVQSEQIVLSGILHKHLIPKRRIKNLEQVALMAIGSQVKISGIEEDNQTEWDCVLELVDSPTPTATAKTTPRRKKQPVEND